MSASTLPASATTPFFFGTGSRRLLGLYNRPDHQSSARTAVLFCNPFGQEAIRSHRMFRVLADRVSRAGFPAMRFDYSCTGDSAGDCDQGRVAQWIADIHTADREIVVRSGATNVVWVGLRFGATLALLASRDEEARNRRLIVWDPVMSGNTYLKELAEAHVRFLATVFRWKPSRVISSRGIGNLGDMRELVGFAVPTALRADFEAIDLSRGIDSMAKSATILADHPVDTYNPLIQSMLRNGTQLRHIPIDTDAPWDSEEALNASTIPARTLDALLSAIERAAT